MRRGMTQVAAYYSEVAAFHKQKFEQANHLAAAALIQVFLIEYAISKRAHLVNFDYTFYSSYD